MNIDLTLADRKKLEQYARMYGLPSIEEAIKHATKQAMARMRPLPAKNGQVIPLEGLKKSSRIQK